MAAALAGASSVLGTTPGKRNFQRLSRLLIAGGTSVLREVFDSIHAPTTLPAVLAKSSVQTQLRHAKLTKPQWDSLFPTPSCYGKSSDLDITLLFKLLRTICSLSCPSSGWDKLPSSADQSVCDDLARVKFYRNEVYGHVSEAMEISDDDFSDLWAEISGALMRLARSVSAQKGQEWQQAIDKLKSDPLTPEDERNIEELKAWYKSDSETKEMLETVHTTIKEMSRKIDQHNAGVSLTINISGHSAVQMDGTSLPAPSVGEIMRAVAADYRQAFPFKSPENFFNFEAYLQRIRLLISDISVSSLHITVMCKSLEILEDLWQNYTSGTLNDAAQRCLVTDEVLKKYNLKQFKLVTTINEEEYSRCKAQFIETQDLQRCDRTAESTTVPGKIVRFPSTELTTIPGKTAGETPEPEKDPDFKSQSIKMAASSLSTALKEQLSCSICLNVFTDPKTLKCLHTFCLPCLKELALKTPPNIPLRCPNCQEDIRLQPGASFDDFPNSFYFKRLLELLNIQEPQQTTANCGSCGKNQPLTSFCFDCGQSLCGECVTAHNLLRALKNHRHVALNQLKDKDIHDFLERPDTCSIEYHDQEKLKYYCEDCKTTICQHCALVEHKSHQYVPIKKAGDQCKEAMTEAVNKMKATIPFIQQAIKKAEESFVMTEQQITAAGLQVDKHVEHIIRLLQQYHTKIISELESIKQREKRRYETKRNDLETKLAQLKSGVEFVDAAVERNLANEIINTHDSVIKRCTDLAKEDGRGNEGKQIRIEYEASKEFVVTTTQVTPGRVLETGLLDPSRSSVDGEILKQATVGKETEFVVITNDSQGEVCSNGGDCVEVTIKSSTGEAVESTVLDQKNGHYTVQYTPRNVGSCDVTVQIAGQAAAGSPFEVQVKEEYTPLKTFGSQGSGAGQFQHPWGIAVNSRGEVAVTDMYNHRIQLFNSDGQHLRTICSKGSAKGEVNLPTGVAFDHQDRLIVADRNNHRIQILTTVGQCVKTFGEEELCLPLGVCVTNEGNIVVCSKDEERGVKVFTEDGVLITQFHDSKREYSPCYVTFSNNKFFVSYASDHGVSVFNKEGILLHSFGERGQLDGQFNFPWGVVIDKSNRVLVCDKNNHRIQVFTREGQLLKKIGQFSEPKGITVSPSGQVYVSEHSGHRVQVLLYE